MKRRLLLTAGCLTLLAVWWGPLAHLAHQAFFVHMAAHMAVVALAAPLLSLGIAGGKYDPVRKFPTLFAAIPASMFEFVVVWAWHAPRLHHLARHETWAAIAEQGTFLLTGLWLWLSAVGGTPADRDSRAAAGFIGLLLTAMHMTLLGVLIGVSPRPLYSHATDIGGLSPLQDQQLGGAVMVLFGGVAYLSGGLGLMRGLLGNRIIRRATQR